MPFDLQKFEQVFGFADEKFSLDNMMTDFAELTDESTDELSVYRAIIATGEFNNNYIYLDEKTMQNIARQSNRETAGNDIPIYPNHQRYDFQIGTMLTGKYLKSRKRVEGTFSIIKDSETEILRNRINNRVVRDVSPTVIGELICDIDGEKMYRYGGSKTGYYLGDRVTIDGKERIVTATFKDAKLVEVSVVSMGAFPGATIFSENKELLEQAYSEGIIDEKAIDVIEYSFSVDLGLDTSKPEGLPPQSEPQSEPEPKGVPPMPQATDADTQLLQDQITDLNNQITTKDQQIAGFQEQIGNMVSAEVHQTVENNLTAANQKLIEKESKLGESAAVVSEYDACVEHVRSQAIEFYAKIRGVEVDDTTDHLFMNRKKNLQEATSLTYLISSFEQYFKDYYASVTGFGGQTTKEQSSPKVPANYTPATGLA